MIKSTIWKFFRVLAMLGMVFSGCALCRLAFLVACGEPIYWEDCVALLFVFAASTILARRVLQKVLGSGDA